MGTYVSNWIHSVVHKLHFLTNKLSFMNENTYFSRNLNHIFVKNRYSVPGKPFIQNLVEGYQTKNISKMKHKHRRKKCKAITLFAQNQNLW